MVFPVCIHHKFRRTPHAQDAWADEVHWMVRPNTAGHGNLSGPLPPFWNLLLLDLPLPNGRKIDFTAKEFSLPRCIADH